MSPENPLNYRPPPIRRRRRFLWRRAIFGIGAVFASVILLAITCFFAYVELPEPAGVWQPPTSPNKRVLLVGGALSASLFILGVYWLATSTESFSQRDGEGWRES